MIASARPDYAREVRNLLHDPVQLVRQLGLTEGSDRSAGGVQIRCPAHSERNASCSVTRGPDGTVRVRCFGCDYTADALGLIATVRSLDAKSEFIEVMAVGAELAGRSDLADEIRGGAPADPQRPRVVPPLPPALPTREFPPVDEVRSLWDASTSVTDDTEVSAYLVGRRLDPDLVALRSLARVLPSDNLPEWARYRGDDWSTLGYRMISRTWSARGLLASVRAWRVRAGDTPKRLPPGGHRATEMALANRRAVAMLMGRAQPRRVIVVEGEPDWIAASLRTDEPVLGIGSGWWCPAMAARIPDGADVEIWTHPDPAGDRYAEQIAATLAERCNVWRGQ
jgi:hypothetical protein